MQRYCKRAQRKKLSICRVQLYLMQR